MPSKNFNILGNIKIDDPKDGKEKLAYHTFSEAKGGVLIIIDPESLTGECYETPGDSGAWALCQYDDKLLMGSCPHKALIYSFDLKSRTFDGEPAKAPGVTYIWTLGRASDGFVYGGTYAECRLMRYDPKTFSITDLGRVDPDENNYYSRSVHCEAPGRLFIDCGYSVKRIFVYDLEKGGFSQFYKDGAQVSHITADYVCVSNDSGDCELLDPYTGKPLYERAFKIEEIPILAESEPIFKSLQAEADKNTDVRLGQLANRRVIKLKNGDMFGLEGQEIFKLAKNEHTPSFHAFPVEPPATCAFGIAVDESGKVWGTSSFGMTAFCYDAKTGESVNTLGLTMCGGECYGVVPYKGKIYFTAYAGGEHIVYDPSQPWRMRENVNPKMVFTVSPGYIRPHTRSIHDGNGVIWTGWLAGYGTYGSAITIWDANTGEIKFFRDIIGENAIEALTLYKDTAIFDTYKGGNGLPTVKDAPKYLCKITSAGEIVQKKEYAESLGSLCINGGGGLISIGGALHLLDPETLLTKPVGISMRDAQIRCIGENVIAVGSECGYIIDQRTGAVLQKTGGVGADVLDVCVSGLEVWAAAYDGWIYKMDV